MVSQEGGSWIKWGSSGSSDCMGGRGSERGGPKPRSNPRKPCLALSSPALSLLSRQISRSGRKVALWWWKGC